MFLRSGDACSIRTACRTDSATVSCSFSGSDVEVLDAGDQTVERIVSARSSVVWEGMTKTIRVIGEWNCVHVCFAFSSVSPVDIGVETRAPLFVLGAELSDIVTKIVKEVCVQHLRVGILFNSYNSNLRRCSGNMRSVSAIVTAGVGVTILEQGNIHLEDGSVVHILFQNSTNRLSSDAVDCIDVERIRQLGRFSLIEITILRRVLAENISKHLGAGDVVLILKIEQEVEGVKVFVDSREVIRIMAAVLVDSERLVQLSYIAVGVAFL